FDHPDPHIAAQAAAVENLLRCWVREYLYKRGTFYPFAPLPGEGQRRDNALELRVRAALGDDLRMEEDLGRWFPVWGAPGL
ncbi:PspA-associated protein PspAB, partial [Streptomyces sp. NPDC003832]